MRATFTYMEPEFDPDLPPAWVLHGTASDGTKVDLSIRCADAGRSTSAWQFSDAHAVASNLLVPLDEDRQPIASERATLPPRPSIAEERRPRLDPGVTERKP